MDTFLGGRGDSSASGSSGGGSSLGGGGELALAKSSQLSPGIPCL